MNSNPLLEHHHVIVQSIAAFKEHARAYYYDVIMSAYTCPSCAGRLTVTGVSEATCRQCRTTIDPTVAFQQSACCGARLLKKRTHYACSRCERTTSSRFLFDEVIFDAEYFRTAMAESRDRKRKARAELRLMLAASHSDELTFDTAPNLNQVPGLVEALTDFLRHTDTSSNDHTAIRSDFHMEWYRRIILDKVKNDAARFESIPTIEEDIRLDRTRRFITLLFMEQSREVWLEQHGADILVVPYEAHD